MEESNPRLGVNDKRYLFQSLLAMTERLLHLNKFPVDMEDFALSLQPPEVEAAWRLINTKRNYDTLAPVGMQCFMTFETKWKLHVYPGEKAPAVATPHHPRIFMDVKDAFDISHARRHKEAVKAWCTRQKRLEEQLLRSAKVLKAVVHSCNTVGQYKRVSPELLTFLPDKYKAALGDYTKQSPYPTITVEPDEIDTTLSTLAFAALQPKQHSEADYLNRPTYGHYSYQLEQFPRSYEYDQKDVRKLEL